MFLKVQNLAKTYVRGDQKVEALRGVSLAFERGGFTSIMGPSGSGKSTFLQILGGLDRPTSGQIEINGEAFVDHTDAWLARFRRQKIGFIFQFFNLFPNLSALENVALPLLLDGKSMTEVGGKAKSLLATVGLEQRLDHMPGELSGGEMQRVAIARALVADPLLVLADEPTGNLDTKTGQIVLQLLAKLTTEFKLTVVMVTHDPRAASFGNRTIHFRDGLIESDGPATHV